MLVNCNVKTIESENISNSVTLIPRLEYSINLLDDIAEMLKEKKFNIKKSNFDLITNFDETDKKHIESIESERIVSFSLEAIIQIKKITTNISDVYSISRVLPVSIPMIRTVSAQLFDILPNCSKKLSELSVHLGSIVLDSATLTKAKFDFGHLNEDSSKQLDKVKLIVDSKISKQYPNLDFFKLRNTWHC